MQLLSIITERVNDFVPRSIEVNVVHVFLPLLLDKCTRADIYTTHNAVPHSRNASSCCHVSLSTFYLSFHAAQNRFSTVLPETFRGCGVMSRADIIAPAFFRIPVPTLLSRGVVPASKVQLTVKRDLALDFRFRVNAFSFPVFVPTIYVSIPIFVG